MLQYERIDVSEGIDVNKTSASKECGLCHYWFFKDLGFKFEEHVCNGCHDLWTIPYSLEKIVILNAKGATFRCILWGISRNEGLRRLNSSVLEKVSYKWKQKPRNKDNKSSSLSLPWHNQSQKILIKDIKNLQKTSPN